jgi:hypothetical protein
MATPAAGVTGGRAGRLAALLIALLLGAPLTHPAAESVAAEPAGVPRLLQQSRGGAFQVAFTSELQPIEINRIHAWVLYLRDADGRPLDDAVVEVTGGMPAHDHGLPTQPRVTRALGDGAYLLEGLRFHMHGLWEIVVTVTAAGQRDRAVIELTL